LRCRGLAHARLWAHRAISEGPRQQESILHVLHALEGGTRRGGPGLTRAAGRPQVSEHATWSSRYYGRIISAALAAVGARRAAAGPCTGTAAQVPSASACGQRPAAHRAPAAITCMLVAARSTCMSLVKGLGLGMALAGLQPAPAQGCFPASVTWCGRRAGRPGADRHGVRRGRGGAGVRRRRQAHLCGQHRGAPRETPAFAVVLLLGNPGAACPVQQAPYGEPARSSTMRYGLLMRRPAGLASPCICSTEMWSTVIRICPNIGHESGPRGCARAAGGPPRDGRCRRYADARDA